MLQNQLQPSNTPSTAEIDCWQPILGFLAGHQMRTETVSLLQPAGSFVELNVEAVG
jgi:hypothetical protein